MSADAKSAKRAARELEVIAAQASLDRELLEVETAGYANVEEWRSNPSLSPETIKEQIEREAASRRSSYAERFTVDSREKAAWAARKIVEARERVETTKEIMKAEVKRAERERDGREEFFVGKLLSWADKEPKDPGTKCSIRLPTGGVRLEVREVEAGGVRFLDERLLAEELIQKLGVVEAVDLGIVEMRPVLVASEAREFIEAHPGLPLSNAVLEPRRLEKKLVIVRITR
jgi:hypothetical protein